MPHSTYSHHSVNAEQKLSRYEKNQKMAYSMSIKHSSNPFKIISPSHITPIQKKPEHLKIQSLCNFLIVYFNCCYYLCCSPFRFTTDTHGLNFKMTGIFPQKVNKHIFVLKCTLNIANFLFISRSSAPF